MLKKQKHFVGLVGLIWLGVYPQPLFELTQPVVDSLSLLVDNSGVTP